MNTYTNVVNMSYGRTNHVRLDHRTFNKIPAYEGLHILNLLETELECIKALSDCQADKRRMQRRLRRIAEFRRELAA